MSYYLYFSRLFSPSILIFLLYLIFAIIFGNCPEIVGFATVLGFSRRFSPTHLLTSALPRSAPLPSPNRFFLCSPLLAEKLLLLFRHGSVGRWVEPQGWRSGCSVCSFCSTIDFACVLLCTNFLSISNILLSCCLRLHSLGFLCC